jgi:hypothetical protein
VKSEESVREELNKQGINLIPIDDERDGGENPNQIDRLVFHNGRTLKFEFMQQEKPVSDEIVE